MASNFSVSPAYLGLASRVAFTCAPFTIRFTRLYFFISGYTVPPKKMMSAPSAAVGRDASITTCRLCNVPRGFDKRAALPRLANSVSPDDSRTMTLLLLVLAYSCGGTEHG